RCISLCVVAWLSMTALLCSMCLSVDRSSVNNDYAHLDQGGFLDNYQSDQTDALSSKDERDSIFERDRGGIHLGFGIGVQPLSSEVLTGVGNNQLDAEVAHISATLDSSKKYPLGKVLGMEGGTGRQTRGNDTMVDFSIEEQIGMLQSQFGKWRT
ncbi:unnamed protein product, partial [Choristocarpus tenellus]